MKEHRAGTHSRKKRKTAIVEKQIDQNWTLEKFLEDEDRVTGTRALVDGDEQYDFI